MSIKKLVLHEKRQVSHGGARLIQQLVAEYEEWVSTRNISLISHLPCDSAKRISRCEGSKHNTNVLMLLHDLVWLDKDATQTPLHRASVVFVMRNSAFDLQ